MNRKIVLAGIAIVTLLLLYFLVDFVSARNSYNKLREEAKSPILISVPIGAQEQEFLQHVQHSWTVFESDSNDEGLIEMCHLMGFEATTSGLVDCLTHEIPSFDLFDKPTNLIEAGRAGALSAIKSVSIDGKIYHQDGVAYIRPRDRIVECYEDTAEGVRVIRYGKVSKEPNNAE